MGRTLSFIFAAMIFTAGFTGQYGVTTPATLQQRQLSQAEPKLLIPEATEPRFNATFNPAIIAEPDAVQAEVDGSEQAADILGKALQAAGEVKPFDPTKIVAVPPMIAAPEAEEPQEEPAFDPTKIEDEQPKPQTKQAAVVDTVTGKTVVGPSIIAMSTPGCPPCIEWWNGRIQPDGVRTVSMRQRFQNANWNVYSHTGGASRYPSYRVYDGKRWHSHTGFLTGAVVQGMLDASGSVSSVSVSESPKVAVSETWKSIPEYTIGGVPWTASALRNHLYTHSNHRHAAGSLNHLTLEELQQLHNAEHRYGKAAVNRVQAKVSSAVYAAASDYCPTCPQQQQSRSTGIFRRWGR